MSSIIQSGMYLVKLRPCVATDKFRNAQRLTLGELALFAGAFEAELLALFFAGITT